MKNFNSNINNVFICLILFVYLYKPVQLTHLLYICWVWEKVQSKKKTINYLWFILEIILGIIQYMWVKIVYCNDFMNFNR